MATGADVVAEVKKFLGDPYVYGAEGPNTFDCSGLVQYVYGQIGVNTPRVSSEQWSWVNKAGGGMQDKSHMIALPGDLIFSQWPGDDATPGHVGIYIGNHQLIEAPKPGGVVQVATIDQYYFDHVYGVGHVGALSPAAGAVADNIDPTSSSTYNASNASNNNGNGGILPPDTPGGVELNWLGHLFGIGNLTGDVNQTASGIGSAISGAGNLINFSSKAIYTLTLPSTWARVGAGLVGTVLLLFGLWHLGKDMARSE